jgi:hypothetical protein
MGDIVPIPPDAPVPAQDNIHVSPRLPPWMVKTAGFTLCGVCFWWAVDNFIQVRDVKSLYFSRVLLFVMWLSATAFVGGITWNRTPKNLGVFGIAVLFAITAAGIDWLVPVPGSDRVATSSSKILSTPAVGSTPPAAPSPAKGSVSIDKSIA